VIEAIAAGKEAALSIDRFIRGEDLSEGRAGDWTPVADIDLSSYEKRPRKRMPRLTPDERIDNFKEVQLGFSEEDVLFESSRCVSCGICSECYTCISACNAGAVDFSQKDKEIELDVGAVVMATGFDLYDVAPLKEYGWGTYRNVLTAMQFERIICASGPTGGHIKRPSDGREPKRLAFIQCVGSRDIRHKKYCSAVCCMHATKEAILAHEHCPELSSTIFYMDMRAVGKGFQDYIIRAKEQYEVRYIRARPGKITINEENENPIIHYDDTQNREVIREEFDMVVLAQALIPSVSNRDIAESMGVELDESGFVETPQKVINPFATTRDGIFGCGFCQSPMDVPDSVVRASAAASRVAELLATADQAQKA